MQLCKRAAAALMTAVLLLAVVSCQNAGQNGQKDQAQGTAGEGKLFSEPTELDILVRSQASWPYNENWKLWQYFQEATGAVLHVKAIPETDYNTKINLMMASPDALPDLLHTITKSLVDQYVLSGALICIDDYAEAMPHFNAYLDSLAQKKRQELLAQRKSGDGKIYFPPVTGTDTVTNLRTWMYRKDIFEEHGLTPPETIDQVYEVSKALKDIYPGSYPLAFRNGMAQLNVIGPSWKSFFNYGAYYDFESRDWHFGAQEDTMLEMIGFFRKMHAEGLVPPDFLTISNKSWEELVATDRGFLMPEYVARIDFFNLPNRLNNPKYTWAGMKPPRADTPTGQHKVAKLNIDPSGYVICNTGKQGQIQNAIKLVDWMYSDEGSELLSWGKENETYRIDAHGKRSFILPQKDDTPQQLYGILTYGLYQRMDPQANEAAYTEEQNTYSRVAYNDTEDHANPCLWLALDDQEQQVRNELYDALYGYTEEGLSKFMLGQKPMSEWDAFCTDLKNMGVDALLGIYDSAYRRAQSAAD